MKNNSDNNSPSSAKSKKKTIFILAGVLLLLVLGILFIMVQKWQQTNMQKKLDLGQSCLSEGKYEEAIRAYQDVIKINEKEKDAYKGLSESFAGIGDYQQAEETAYSGIEKLEDNNQKVEMYQVLVDLYTEEAKPQEDLQLLKDEAFQETGKREFGEKYEKMAKRYLENISCGYSNYIDMVPPFETADQIDKNWLFSMIPVDIQTDSQKTDKEFSDGEHPPRDLHYGAALSAMEENAQNYFNPDVVMPKNFDYQLIEGQKFFWKAYDPETGGIYFALKGEETTPGKWNDFYVTNFYKEDDNYMVEGVLLAIKIQNMTAYNQSFSSSGGKTRGNGMKCDVFLDNTETGTKIGTAVLNVSQQPKEPLEGYYQRETDNVSFDYEFTNFEADVYQYCLKDNPDGVQTKENKNTSFGPFYLMSRTLAQEKEPVSMTVQKNEKEDPVQTEADKSDEKLTEAAFNEAIQGAWYNVDEMWQFMVNNGKMLWGPIDRIAATTIGNYTIEELFLNGARVRILDGNTGEYDRVINIDFGEPEDGKITIEGKEYLAGELLSNGRYAYPEIRKKLGGGGEGAEMPPEMQ